MDIVGAPHRICVTQRRGAATALPVSLVIQKVAAALHAADRTKNGLPRWPTMKDVATHAASSTVVRVVRKFGQLAIRAKGADQRTMATATATTGLYLAIEPFYGIIFH